MFKFAMNAAVMLATSADAYAAQQRNQERESSSFRKHGASYKLLEMVAPIEAGIVIGRIEYATAENAYLVRYRGGDGRQVENFVTESALIEDPRVVTVADEPVADRAHERAVILRYALSDLLEFGENATLSPEAIKAMEETLANYTAASRDAFSHGKDEAPKVSGNHDGGAKSNNWTPIGVEMVGDDKQYTVKYTYQNSDGEEGFFEITVPRH